MELLTSEAFIKRITRQFSKDIYKDIYIYIYIYKTDLGRLRKFYL